mmetsp:Transcript_17062/g.28543  ORF Transcript_17062/g.28543 Transcript_17062/m.28543 type:complete len:182 (-) Transcript_17062:218-763(-)
MLVDEALRPQPEVEQNHGVFASISCPLPEQNCAVGRHKAWVRALRSEYNERVSQASSCRVSHASSCDWDDDEHDWPEQTGEPNDIAGASDQPGSFELATSFDQSLLLDQYQEHPPIYRALTDVASNSTPPLQRHSAIEGASMSSRRQNLIEDVDALWLCANPPLLQRQSAPDLLRLVQADW